MNDTLMNNTIHTSSSEYFAAKESTDVASYLEAKINERTNSININGYLDKLRASYAMYHGAYYTDSNNGHQVSFGGEQGELVNFPVNHYRNLATHMLNMTVANRPAVDCRATNSDYKSQVQTYLGNSILEYYIREKKLEVFLKKAVEYGIVYGSGFVLLGWDATKGEVVDYIEETKTKIYEGDITFENLSELDVFSDETKESGIHDWRLIRRWKNKYDLAAKFPEYADDIKGLETKSDMMRYRLNYSGIMDKTDDVAVFEFFHERTDSMPDGRYLMFLTRTIILQDLPLPYRGIPLFRVAPSDVHGTPHGYTAMFDLMPLQEVLNSLYSTVATNQNAFGVQNVIVPRGSDISVNQLQGGLNVIEYNAAGGPPQPLNLTNTPAEVFKFIQMIEQVMETLSGVNSVARGQPEASLKSGTALALVQSMALQFMSGLQQSYVELIEQCGTFIIKMLQDFAHTPRMVAIAGKSNRTYLKEFNSEDISNISRVVVDVGNPMARTVAGRSQMAEQLIQYGDITPQQYVSLIHTGNLDAITEEIIKEEFLIRAENEALLDGELPMAIYAESHKKHIDGHRSVLFDPELKKDAGLVQRVFEHMQQHVQMLRTVDPDMLMLLDQQPLSPQPQPTQSQQEPPQGGDGLGPSGMMPPEQGQVGPGVMGGHMQGPGEPSVKIPQPATVNGALLPNPALQQQSLNNLRK